jgi:protoporphyrinogen oxidase
MYKQNVILGGGLAGLSASYVLERDNSIVFEQRNRCGGLCDNFTIDGFLFDYAPHFSFANEHQVRELFDKEPYTPHKPAALNYDRGYWIKHPVQNNSFPLPTEEKVRIIKGFIDRPSKGEIYTYEDWLFFQYGKYFSEKYPFKYTRKYWCNDPKDLSVDWINGRMYQPSIDEVLIGAMEDSKVNTYYATEMRYPITGGFKAFLKDLINSVSIEYNKKAIRIDIENKRVFFSDGSMADYKNLISSLPICEIVKMLDNVPSHVKECAARLYATSICIVSMGFDKLQVAPSLWFYIYDEDIPYARGHAPNWKATSNAPEGKCSLQFEIHYTKNRPLGASDDQIKENVMRDLVKMKLCNPEDVLFIDVRHIKYGNVVFYIGMEADRQVVTDYLDSLGIIRIGRFGLWDYLWTHQTMMSGFDVKNLI